MERLGPHKWRSFSSYVQSYTFDYVGTALRAGFTDYVDDPFMNQGTKNLHSMVMAVIVQPYQCIKNTARRDMSTQTSDIDQ